LIAFDTEMIPPERQKCCFKAYYTLKTAFKPDNGLNQKSVHFYEASETTLRQNQPLTQLKQPLKPALD